MSAAIRRAPSPGAPAASTAPSRRNSSSAPFGSPLDTCASAHSQAFSTRATALDGSFDAASAKNFSAASQLRSATSRRAIRRAASTASRWSATGVSSNLRAALTWPVAASAYARQ